MALLGIARGAAGVLLYIREAPSGALVDASRALAEEVAALSPALTHRLGVPLAVVTRSAPSPRVCVRGVSVPTDADEGGAARAAGGGSNGFDMPSTGPRNATLLVVNGHESEGGALTLFIPALMNRAHTLATLLFPRAGRTVEVRYGVLSDALAPMDAAAYSVGIPRVGTNGGDGGAGV